jgi:hypothetical protein
VEDKALRNLVELQALRLPRILRLQLQPVALHQIYRVAQVHPYRPLPHQLVPVLHHHPSTNLVPTMVYMAHLSAQALLSALLLAL